MAGDLHSLLGQWADEIHGAIASGLPKEALHEFLIDLYDRTAVGIVVVRTAEGVVLDATTDNPFIQGAVGLVITDEEDGEQAEISMENGTGVPLDNGNVVIGIGWLGIEDLSEEQKVFEDYEARYGATPSTPEFPTSFSPPSRPEEED